MEIIGLMMVRNDDLFVAQAVTNALDFCDRFIILLHQSTDDTAEILNGIHKLYPNKVVINLINDIEESHNYVLPFIGTQTWMLSVDGDEIYDPEGLRRLRGRLLSRDYDKYWRIYGHALNVTKLNIEGGTASGYASPPGHPMTKLYNMAAIDSWSGAIQRLHGGSLILKKAYHHDNVYCFFHHANWSDSDFKCLHMVFIKRSSQDSRIIFRKSPADILHRKHFRRSMLAIVKLFFYDLHISMNRRSGKHIAYQKGPLIKREVSSFFRTSGSLI